MHDRKLEHHDFVLYASSTRSEIEIFYHKSTLYLILKSWDLSKLQAFAIVSDENKVHVFVVDWLENTVGKGETNGYNRFLLFSQSVDCSFVIYKCFQFGPVKSIDARQCVRSDPRFTIQCNFPSVYHTIPSFNNPWENGF